MKIKFTRTVAGQYGVFHDGQIADLPKEYAEPIIADRGAVAVGMFGNEKPSKIERATLKRKPETPEGDSGHVDAEETA
jgi:cephalosporin hydroxylase